MDIWILDATVLRLCTVFGNTASKPVLWAHCDSWHHLNMACQNSGLAYPRGCKFVQRNVGSWQRPVCVLTCPNKYSSQTRALFSLQQHTTPDFNVVTFSIATILLFNFSSIFLMKSGLVLSSKSSLGLKCWRIQMICKKQRGLGWGRDLTGIDLGQRK